MDFMAQLHAMGAAGSGGIQGAMLQELRKALSAGYGTDPATFTGGTAFRIQSLDHTMKATIQENDHFVLFNALAKSNAGATVDEWTEQRGVGGFPGGSTNTEAGDINAATGDYARMTALVKYLMTRREVTFVGTLGNNIVEMEAVEAKAGAIQLLTDAEYLCFEGDSTVVPTEFDGIDAQVKSLNNPDHIVDAAGSPLNSIAQMNAMVGVAVGYGNFGKPTDLFMSNGAQIDFDNSMDPAARVSLTSMGANDKIEKGSPVQAVRTSWGVIKLHPDVFVRDEPQMAPFDVLYPVVATAQAAIKPVSVTLTAQTGVSGSNWQSSHAGQFYYGVAGINNKGQSGALVSAAATVVTGGAISIAIAASASALETGYVIYRSRKNGTNALSDLRQMVRVAKAGATTTYVDTNQDFPGTTKARLLTMGAGSDAINWRQLLPMTKFPLYPTSAPTVPWAQLLFGYLRLAKRRQHIIVKNIVTGTQVWKPFG